MTPAELKTATLLPLNDRVLVRPLPPDQATEGGIVLPDTVQQELPGIGTVVRVAPTLSVLVAIGDIVTFARHAGTPAQVQGEELLLVRSHDIIGVYVEPIAAGLAEGLDG